MPGDKAPNKFDDLRANSWEKSRQGAWAGRGFHYQHLFSTLILVNQWAGLAPVGFLIPEGEQDCVVEMPNRELWIQIKSRKKGVFGAGEVQSILQSIKLKAESAPSHKPKSFRAGLEQQVGANPEKDILHLFEDDEEAIVICPSPVLDIDELLSEKLGVAPILAEGIRNDLYNLVATSAAGNAHLEYEKRRRISTTEVECRIHERLEAEDASKIDQALNSGALETEDLVTPVSESGFYQGVKVIPGHVAERLVLQRPAETQDLVELVRKYRQVLVNGPSGAGKSALVWLAADSLAGEMTWFRVSDHADVQFANSIYTFIKSRRPKSSSPVGLIFDDMGKHNSNLWGILSPQLRALPDVYLLGSIRNGYVELIPLQSEIEFFEVRLDKELAQDMWSILSRNNQTDWQHWQEPYEESSGLLLEYIHLLIEGKKLAAVIRDQVRQREREERNDELQIIRSTSVLNSLDGEVQVEKLLTLLKLPRERANQALNRLIDEHLVRERSPGVLGGLHSLRSKALRDASHNDVYLEDDSLWISILASTVETLPRVILALFREGRREAEILQKLSKAITASTDNRVWSAVLTGLGLGTLEQYVSQFVENLQRRNVEPMHWYIASVLVDPSFRESSFVESLLPIRDAISEFLATPGSDLRIRLLDMLPTEKRFPACTNFEQANHLLSSLAPIAGRTPVAAPVTFDFSVAGEPDVQEVAKLLSTASLLGDPIVDLLMDASGGEQALLALFTSQTPWVQETQIQHEEPHDLCQHRHGIQYGRLIAVPKRIEWISVPRW